MVLNLVNLKPYQQMTIHIVEDKPYTSEENSFTMEIRDILLFCFEKLPCNFDRNGIIIKHNTENSDLNPVYRVIPPHSTFGYGMLNNAQKLYINIDSLIACVNKAADEFAELEADEYIETVKMIGEEDEDVLAIKFQKFKDQELNSYRLTILSYLLIREIIASTIPTDFDKMYNKENTDVISRKYYLAYDPAYSGDNMYRKTIETLTDIQTVEFVARLDNFLELDRIFGWHSGVKGKVFAINATLSRQQLQTPFPFGRREESDEF